MNHTPTLPDLGPEEHDLRDLMVRALRDAEPPGGLADAAARGRGLRRRRRATAGLATLTAAAAAVAVAVALTGGNTERTGQAVDPAAPPSSAAPDTPVPPPAAEPTRPPGIPAYHWRQFPREWKEYFGAPTPAWIDVPAAELRDRLAPLLPDGVRIESAELTSTDVAPGESPEVRGSVLVVLADAAGGRASLEVMLARRAPEPPEPGSITVRGRHGNEAGYAVPEVRRRTRRRRRRGAPRRHHRGDRDGARARRLGVRVDVEHPRRQVECPLAGLGPRIAADPGRGGGDRRRRHLGGVSIRQPPPRARPW